MATGNELVERFAQDVWAALRKFWGERPDGMTDDKIRETFGGIFGSPEVAEQVIADLQTRVPAWEELNANERAAVLIMTMLRLLPPSTETAMKITDARKLVAAFGAASDRD